MPEHENITAMADLHESKATLYDSSGGTIISADGSELYLTEQAAAAADRAGFGQIWVKNDTPNTLWFTDDGGTDYQLGAASGATTALDNLAAVAINTSLVSDTDATDDLGSASIAWRRLYLQAGSATDVPVNIELATTPTGNAIQVSSVGTSSGDLFKVAANGAVTLAAGNPYIYGDTTNQHLRLDSGAVFLSAGSTSYVEQNGTQIKLRATGNELQWNSTNILTIPGKVTQTVQSATDIGYAMTLATTPTGNAIQVTSNGGSAGDLFAVTSTGRILADELYFNNSGAAGVPNLTFTSSSVSLTAAASNYHIMSGDHRFKSGASSNVVYWSSTAPNKWYSDGTADTLGNPGLANGHWMGCYTAHAYEAHTSGDTLTLPESNSLHSNAGATARVDLVLPTSSSATKGITFTFLCADTDGIRIDPAGSDTIRVGASVSTATTGYVETTTVGNVIRITCIDTGVWYAEYQIGTWTVV